MGKNLLIICLLIPALGMSQAKRAQNQLAKQKYADAYQLLVKGVSKDSLASAESFVLSQLFMVDSSGYYNIDSAYYYAERAIADFSGSDVKTQSRLEKDGFEDSAFVVQRQIVETAAFKLTKLADTEVDYSQYLVSYPLALQKDSAITFRNARAFETAQELNTFNGYKQFFNTYPNASEVPEAKKRYEKLLFEYHTADGKLSSYELFIKDYPDTPYRDFCERKVFDIRTGANTPEAYHDFMARYPQSVWRRRAENMLFHLLEVAPVDLDGLVIAQSDSLKEVLELQQQEIILVPNEDEYQLINVQNEIILDGLEQVAQSFKCTQPTDFIFGERQGIIGLFGINGALIAKVSAEDVGDEGFGFVKTISMESQQLVHKSGINLEQLKHNQVELVYPYAAYKNQQGWGLMSVTGRPMLPEEYDSIYTMGDNIVLLKNGKTGIFPPDTFIPLLDGNEVALTFPYDDIELFSTALLWVLKEDQEGLLNADLGFVLPLADQLIEPLDSGYFIDRGDSIYDSTYDDRWFTSRESNSDWSITHTSSKDIVVYQNDATMEFQQAALIGSHGLLVTDSLGITVMFSDSLQQVLNDTESIEALGSLGTAHSSSHYKLSYSGKKLPEILDLVGKKVRTSRYQKVYDLGTEYLLAETRKKFVVLDNYGRVVLKNLDGAKLLSEGVLSIFTDREFGVYSRLKIINIPRQYDRALVPLNDSLFIASKNEKYGIVNALDEVFLPFQFSDIKPYNDSLLVVTTNYVQAFINLNSKRTLIDRLSSFELMFNRPNEEILLIERNGNYGIFSTRRGLILDPTFSEVLNIGSTIAPIFRATKYISEADLFILLYYNANGELFKKVVLSAQQFDRLNCGEKNI
jgi:hypothetical protein